MSRDFEFKQLLRAYRSGIISETTFESEMKSLESGVATSNGNGGSFKAFGRSYKSERAAVVSFLDKVRAGEANGGEAFAAWAEVCKTDCIRSGIRMIAEREAYHSRIFGQRLVELGGEARATPTEEGRKFREYLGSPSIPDNQKLLRFTSTVGGSSPKMNSRRRSGYGIRARRSTGPARMRPNQLRRGLMIRS